MYANYFKRLFDFVISLCTVILLSPLELILVILGFIFMRGNPFFIQERPGKNEKIFKLVKFRTMDNRKDKNGNILPDDVRLNKYGRILRSTSLDELPELLNIIKGDMAIVGPRPLLVRYLPYYTSEEKHRHDVRPGLTGLSQIHGRNYTPWEERFKYDLMYIRNITFCEDFKILIATIKIVLSHSGVADRSQIHTDEKGNIFIIINGEKHAYPKPLDIERK